jgi:hypothetical protein
MVFNPALTYQTSTDLWGNIYAYQGGVYYDKWGDVLPALPSGPPGYAAPSDRLGTPANGDQGVASLDPSFFREGTQSSLTSGAWYTALGNQQAMKIWSHNCATVSLSGNLAGRDDAGPVSALVYAEDETLHGLGAVTGAAGTVPTLLQNSFWNLLTGQSNFANVATGYRASAMPANAEAQAVSDGTLVLTPVAGATLTLLAASAANKGQILNLVLQASFATVSASANVIPLAGGSAATTLFSAATAGKFVTLQSTGAAWQIIAAN